MCYILYCINLLQSKGCFQNLEPLCIREREKVIKMARKDRRPFKRNFIAQIFSKKPLYNGHQSFNADMRKFLLQVQMKQIDLINQHTRDKKYVILIKSSTNCGKSTLRASAGRIWPANRTLPTPCIGLLIEREFPTQKVHL